MTTSQTGPQDSRPEGAGCGGHGRDLRAPVVTMIAGLALALVVGPVRVAGRPAPVRDRGTRLTRTGGGRRLDGSPWPLLDRRKG